MLYLEREGNLINLAKEGEFDVIAHGCNCLCTMGAGLAPQMHKAFGCGKFPLENFTKKGDYNKLGQIDYKAIQIKGEDVDWKVGFWNKVITTKALYVVNAYTQFNYGRNHKDGDQAPLDYEAIRLCFRKMNSVFKGMRIGLPKIGCDLAGGDWEIVKSYIKEEFRDCEVTVVFYDKTKTNY